jgi:hypothetical protein
MCKGDAARFEATLRNTPGRGHKMYAIKSGNDYNFETGIIELETEFLFENQWNSNVGRVFDWYEEAVFDSRGKERKNIKRGHYLEITPEMAEIRRNTLKCGYTGQQFPAAKGYIFNETENALGSPYLKESELHALEPRRRVQEVAEIQEIDRAHRLQDSDLGN